MVLRLRGAARRAPRWSVVWQRAHDWRTSPGRWSHCLIGRAWIPPCVRPACQEPQHSSWRPLHEEIHPFILNWGKAQPFVEPQSRVELLHMDVHGLVGGGFGQEVAQDGAADAGVAGGRQQRDVHYMGTTPMRWVGL